MSPIRTVCPETFGGLLVPKNASAVALTPAVFPLCLSRGPPPRSSGRRANISDSRLIAAFAGGAETAVQRGARQGTLTEVSCQVTLTGWRGTAEARLHIEL